MKSLFEYLGQHPMAAVGLVALIILTVFVWIKAVSASKRHNDERDRIIADLEKEKSLRNEFRHVDDMTFQQGKDDYRLIVGMCAHVQMSIEKAADLNGAFAALSEVKRNIYSLGYVFDDGINKLSEFFRSNGEPLLSAAKHAVDEVIGGEFAEIFAGEFNMFDESNESVSVTEAAIDEWNGKYSSFMEAHKAEIYKKAANYIRDNKAEF